ncbi:unnamed protein product [Linum trigynum]|uniref:Calcineurin-like phosphoesterase domain-containing protein n=1 Tax=Linum trigynum TaxID=586398 RepID=A0AAV2D8L1_9ROSI
MAIPLLRTPIHQSNPLRCRCLLPNPNSCTATGYSTPKKKNKQLLVPVAASSSDLNSLRTDAGRRTCDVGNNTSISSLEPILAIGDPPTFVSAPGRRIVAVGDLHGDLDQTRCALQIAGVLSSDCSRDSWIGGETVLVQLGDVLDRGQDEIAILSLLRSLDVQARAQGGAVFQINGNHETMNVEGDFRYVDSGAYDECLDFLTYLDDGFKDDWDEGFIGWVRASEKRRQEQKASAGSHWGQWNLLKRQKGVVARSILLRPGGPLACELAKHGVLLKINDWVFCHGGILPHHVAYGVERMNREVSQWMRGVSYDEDDPSIPSMPFVATRGYDSVVWNRLYSRDPSAVDGYQMSQVQMILEDTLRSLGAKGIVVGHTPQTAGANCEYNGSVWRVDVGMSKGVFNSSPEVLEIKESETRVLRYRKDSVCDVEVAGYL